MVMVVMMMMMNMIMIMIVPVKDGCNMSLWCVSFCSFRFVSVLGSSKGCKNLSVQWTYASSGHKKSKGPNLEST